MVEEWRKHTEGERTFSSLGFAKGALPRDLFASMASFYYNNRHHAVNEEWEGKGVFVNWWETDVKFVAVPWRMKKKWQLRLMELVSAWAGVELEETSMYGLRQYETGARLLSHVDRLPTHAVSLIVNIAQDNLANPWPVEVFDHADRLHEVTMDAGEVIYYESARNLHSRNRPLTCKKGGCRFINLFTHYRPVVDGSRWHKNMSDMPNRPPPLAEGDVDFDARESACVFSNETADADGEVNGDNVLGVGTVRCEDRRLGRYLSPTLFKARGADDLFRWWKATKNAHLTGFDDRGEPVYHPEAATFAAAYEPFVERRPEPVAETAAFDQHERCGEWADKGECQANAKYMMEMCERSCNIAALVALKKEQQKEEFLESQSSDDKDDRCRQWAKDGECTNNANWMWENCKKSCHNVSAMNEEEGEEHFDAEKEESDPVKDEL